MGRKKADVRKYFDFESNGTMANCKFCMLLYKHINVTKMLKHLEKKCTKCPVEVREYLKPMEQCSKLSMGRDDADLEESALQSTRSISPPAPDFEPSTSINPLWSRSSSRSSMSMTPFVDTIMNSDEQESPNQALARAIYMSGTPPMVVEHPLWINLCKELHPSYKLPTRKAISRAVAAGVQSTVDDEREGGNRGCESSSEYETQSGAGGQGTDEVPQPVAGPSICKPKKMKFGSEEPEEIKNLTNTQLQRLVLKKQLEGIRLKEVVLKKQLEIMRLKEEKLLWEKSLREERQ